MHADRAAESGRCWHKDRTNHPDPVIRGNETCWAALALPRLCVTRTFRRPALPVKWSPDPVKRKSSSDKSS